MTTRRRSARRTRRLQVTFWRRGDSHGHAGFTTNISTTGMFIGTHHPCAQGTRLRIEVIDRDHGFVVEGVVAHARRGGYDLGQHTPSGMGVRFLAVEELVRELVPGVEGEEVYAEPGGPRAGFSRSPGGTGPLLETSSGSSGQTSAGPVLGAASGAAPAPASPLPPAPATAPSGAPGRAAASDGLGAERVFGVRFASAEQFLQVFRRDIANGGLFVSTPDPARIQDVVTVELHPPEAWAEAIRFRARVVHRVEARPGSGLAGPNLLAGMGVELLDTPALSARLKPLVERLAAAEG